MCSVCVRVFTVVTVTVQQQNPRNEKYNDDLSYNLFNTLWKTNSERTEAEFLDVIGIKFLRVFLLTIHINLYPTGFNPPPPHGAKVVRNCLVM